MEVLITKVKSENGWLSCMSPHSVEYQSVKYRTAEALFQALRFDKYPEVQKEVQEAKSPKWDEAEDDIPRMKMVLQLKLEQHPELKQKLLDTGDALIAEDCSTHDRESARWWGMVNKEWKWIGENVFGKIWMKIREEMKFK